ncbi:MAG: hypothetical protein WAT39_26590, partial [Planctomycetota bacterium]
MRTTTCLFVVTLTACAAAPPPATPAAELDLEVPAAFVNAGAAPGAAIPDDFWSGFGDARLDELVRRGCEHNRDLRAAQARLEAAAAAATIAG